MKQIFFAQKAFIVKNDMLLMIRKSKHEKPNPLRWDLPGGRMDFGEEIDNSLKREIFEEVGINAHVGKPYYLKQWYVTRHVNGTNEPLEMQIVCVFRACSAMETQLTNENSTETEQIELIEWIPIDNILELDIMPALVDVIKEFIQDFKNKKIDFPE